MTTSANVVEHRIFKDGEQVGKHRQHIMCKTHWDELCRFAPLSDYEIQEHGLDEHEAPWEGPVVPLEDFLLRIAESGVKKLLPLEDSCYWVNEYNGQTSQRFSWKYEAIIAFHCGFLVWGKV